MLAEKLGSCVQAAMPTGSALWTVLHTAVGQRDDSSSNVQKEKGKKDVHILSRRPTYKDTNIFCWGVDEGLNYAHFNRIEKRGPI